MCVHNTLELNICLTTAVDSASEDTVLHLLHLESRLSLWEKFFSRSSIKPQKLNVFSNSEFLGATVLS